MIIPPPSSPRRPPPSHHPEVPTDRAALAHRSPTVPQQRPADPRQQNRAALAGEQAGGCPSAQENRRVKEALHVKAQKGGPQALREREACGSRNIFRHAQHAAWHGHGMSNHGSARVDRGPQAGGTQVNVFGLAWVSHAAEEKQIRRGAPAWCQGPSTKVEEDIKCPKRDGLAGPCAGATQRGWVHRTAGAIYRPCACARWMVGEDVKCPSSRCSTEPVVSALRGMTALRVGWSMHRRRPMRPASNAKRMRDCCPPFLEWGRGADSKCPRPAHTFASSPAQVRHHGRGPESSTGSAARSAGCGGQRWPPAADLDLRLTSD